jgi:hypothetical protein
VTDEFATLPLASPLTPLQGLVELPADEITRDTGSRPYLYIRAANFADYYCKGPSLPHDPPQPYVGVNEWVGASLARGMGIPVRPFDLITWQGALFFGSQLLPNDRKLTGPLTDANWKRLSNAPNVAYPVVVLDVWLLNTDRSEENWLGGVSGRETGVYMANDHDACLMGRDREPAQLAAQQQQAIYPGVVGCEIFRNEISDWGLLRAAIAAATSLDDTSLGVVVGQLPDEWIDAEGKTQVFAFLRGRRDALGGLFEQHAGLFPNLALEAP